MPYCSSLPSYKLFKHSDIAQLVEQVAVNHRVVGSSPTVGAI